MLYYSYLQTGRTHYLQIARTIEQHLEPKDQFFIITGWWSKALYYAKIIEIAETTKTRQAKPG